MITELLVQKKEAIWVNGAPLDLKLRLIAGEINFICGPNGAGKTSVLTFLKGNQDLFNNLKIAFMDQGRLAPLGSLSVKESIQIIKEECGIDPNTFRPELLKGLESKKVKDLSGGENQLLKYALATASYFDILFVDEPLLNLDPKNKKQFISFFKELANLGKTIVIVEHEPERYGKIEGLVNQVIELGDRKELVSG